MNQNQIAVKTSACYTLHDVMQLARRFHNTKRQYLLVNPMQAKHIPVRPETALAMMDTLGAQLASECPEPLAVISFAETATAIGTVAALSFPDETLYLQTTREQFPEFSDLLGFTEDHSHAVEQVLCAGILRGLNGGTVILIDDEISTGKTVLNIVRALRAALPGLRDTRFLIGSIINRIPEDMLPEFAEENIVFSSLVVSENTCYEEVVQAFNICQPVKVASIPCMDADIVSLQSGLADVRTGMTVGKLRQAAVQWAEESAMAVRGYLRPGSAVTVVGTEECMFAGLTLANALAVSEDGYRVCSHATTRSPIGVWAVPGYPVQNGFELESFYEAGRKTFLYNLRPADTVIFVTDSRDSRQIEQAVCSLTAAFGEMCGHYLVVRMFR